MKKCYLFLAICLVAGCLFAQSTTKHQMTALAKNPALLTPALKQALFENGTTADGYLPPMSLEPYALTDSLYFYGWNAAASDWQISETWHYTNDCETGKRLSYLIKSLGIGSTMLTNSSRADFTYFPDGSSQTTTNYRWLTAQNDWVQSGYTIYIAPGKKSESWSKSWDTNTNSFIFGSRDVLEYDNNLVLQSITSYDWDEATGDWILSDRETLSYTNGLLSEKLKEFYDDLNNNWYLYSRELNEYDSSSNLLEKQEQNYTNGNWSTTYKTTYEYNTLNQEIARLKQIADGNGVFTDFERWESEYYGIGQPHYSQSYAWSASQQDWLLNYRDSFGINGALMLLMTKYNYDDATGTFLFGFRVIFENGANGLYDKSMTDELVFGTLDTWKPYSMATYTHDAYNQQLETINKIWDNSINDYVNNQRTYNFNTGCLFDAVEEIKANAANCLHANPIRSGQAIRCDALPLTDAPMTLSLYALSGIKTHSQAFRSGDAFQSEKSLAPGLYIMEIKAANNQDIYRSKVVVME